MIKEYNKILWIVLLAAGVVLSPSVVFVQSSSVAGGVGIARAAAKELFMSAVERQAMSLVTSGTGLARSGVSQGTRTTAGEAGSSAGSSAQTGVRSMRVAETDPSLAGTRTLGYTTPEGEVFLKPGLSRAEQLATLRHESVHAFLTPQGNGAIDRVRQTVGQWAYDNSQLVRFTEEAIAETYSSGSLIQGLSHPLNGGYGITIGRLAIEGAAYGGSVGGLGYLGYRLGGGGE